MLSSRQGFINALLVIGSCAFAVVACAPKIDWDAERARIANECKAQGFKKRYDQVKCENTAQQRLMDSVGYNDPDFDAYLLKRLQIAAAQDAKRITTQEAELKQEEARIQYLQKADKKSEEKRRERQEQTNYELDKLNKQLQYNNLLHTLQNQQPQKLQQEDLSCHTRCDRDMLGSKCHTYCD